ncbi:NFACT RNA binding domain-containing protein [Spirosoma sp.]|uniref:NFACT RNA binding domain-containing protein n=1 Tax=Spirosoma sp. TaxID=1899569 RepID=UPI0026309829|nr:NFACT RNA binding domain-containing protein [Spirosoma sp.]MCX6218182.1 NFACT RNA binding domain-containing protein [Spirosoma sp.]
MHTNFYFLKQLGPALEGYLLPQSPGPNIHANESITGLRFMACFSQDRDEVVLVFAQAKGKINYYKPFYIKASLRPDFSGLFFPESVQRARTNSVDLFESIVGEPGKERAVIGVRTFLNERCLAIVLEDDVSLVFKFFGNRPNLLAFQGNEVVDLFNRQLATDSQLLLDGFDRPIDQSYAAFEQANFERRKLFPTFGKVVNRWIDEQEAKRAVRGGPEKWAVLQDALYQLEHPHYFLIRLEHKPTLSLLPFDDLPADTPRREFTDPIEAANRFYTSFNGLTVFEHEKANLLKLLEKRRKRAESQIDVSLQRLLSKEEGASHEEKGHILMANLHDIPSTPSMKSPERVTLYDFYRDQPLVIKLKPDLTPQKNAENYYRKAKNEKLEEQHFSDQIAAREAEIVRIDQQKIDLEAIKTLKDLRRYIKQHNLLVETNYASAGEAAPLFKEIMFDSFRILIGRNAKNNDLLTQRYTYKDDLWLHARDVSGSHVVIKYQPGKAFPKRVVERAAELAAWYSKRKMDSLCPVTVTPKKYVRKPKGLAEGQVIIEKEDVVLVVPKGE